MENMDKLEYLAVKEEEILKQIDDFNALEKDTYLAFLKENELNEDVELKIRYRNKYQFKKGRIIIEERGGREKVGRCCFRFYPYTKNGELTINNYGFIATPERILEEIKLGFLRSAKNKE